MSKGLFLDLYELTMAQVYFKYRRRASATFDLFLRSPERPFYVACGIDDALRYLEELRFTREDIAYLRGLALFDDDFLDYLRKFRFNGEVWGVEEPEIIFPQEPILRVSGNLIEAQIVESALLNKINLGTTLATKAARVVLAAKNRGVYDFSLRRTQGMQASLGAAKYSYLAGARGTSNLYAGFLNKIPVVGTMAHSFVMSFAREISSFIAFALQFPSKSILLVDTYDTKEGIFSAIKAAKVLKRRGFELLGIRLDSGNLAEDARYARKTLDKAGLIDVLIFASGNLDEYSIEKLIAKNVPIDAFGVGTNMGCSKDLPYSDVIYKLVEIKEKGKDFIPTMKLSKGKITLPSRKQIFRFFNQRGVMLKDYIGLDKETAKDLPLRGRHKRLLKKIIAGGRRVSEEKSLKEKRKIFLEKVKKLPSAAKKLQGSFAYPVLASERLSSLVRKVKKQIKLNTSPRVIFIDIDTQYDFLDRRGALYVDGAERIIPSLKKLIGFAKRRNLLVLSSQDTHKKGDAEFRQFPPHCLKGSRGQRKIEESTLKVRKVLACNKVYSHSQLDDCLSNYPQIIIEKNSLDIFSNPNTLNLLEALSPEEVVVFGVVTEYCIKEAVQGFLALGLSVSVVKDAVKEVSVRDKDKLFSLWRRKGVKFITTKRLLAKI